MKKPLHKIILFTSFLFLICFSFLNISGCKPKESPASGPDVLIQTLAKKLMQDDAKPLIELCDWNSMYENFMAHKDLAKPTAKETLYEQFIKGMLLMFKPGSGGSNIILNTKTFCHSEIRCDVFLYDGSPDGGGSINLTFELEKRDNRWKLTYTNFYTYGRWAITSSRELRQAYRQKMLSQFE